MGKLKSGLAVTARRQHRRLPDAHFRNRASPGPRGIAPAAVDASVAPFPMPTRSASAGPQLTDPEKNTCRPASAHREHPRRPPGRSPQGRDPARVNPTHRQGFVPRCAIRRQNRATFSAQHQAAARILPLPRPARPPRRRAIPGASSRRNPTRLGCACLPRRRDVIDHQREQADAQQQPRARQSGPTDHRGIT